MAGLRRQVQRPEGRVRLLHDSPADRKFQIVLLNYGTILSHAGAALIGQACRLVGFVTRLATALLVGAFGPLGMDGGESRVHDGPDILIGDLSATRCARLHLFHHCLAHFATEKRFSLPPCRRKAGLA